MGYVYHKNGKYLNHHEYTTHTGTHREVEWVEDLNRARVFYSLPPYALRKDELTDAEMLQATETRTVSLATPNSNSPTENVGQHLSRNPNHER